VRQIGERKTVHPDPSSETWRTATPSLDVLGKRRSPHHFGAGEVDFLCRVCCWRGEH